MQSVIYFVLICFLTIACGPFGGPRRPEPIAPRPVSGVGSSQDGSSARNREIALDGRGLYEKLCASCHRALEQSEIARASFESIRAALLNVPDMLSLPDLTNDQVNALVAVVSKIPPGKANKTKP